MCTKIFRDLRFFHGLIRDFLRLIVYLISIFLITYMQLILMTRKTVLRERWSIIQARLKIILGIDNGLSFFDMSDDVIGLIVVKLFLIAIVDIV